MKRVYYGTCKTASDAAAKKVYVPDLDILDENFNFDEGDLLVVFFAQSNTVDAPSIVIYSQDPEQESSTTSDSGKYIKSLDVTADLADSWAAGETLIFAYTQEGVGEAYYWELIDAAHATIDVYGNTKLFDDSNFIEWLADEEIHEEDSEIALTPNTLKKFYQLLIGNNSSQEEEEPDPEPEPEPDPEPDPEPEPEPEPEPVIIPPLGLKWTPSESVTQYETQPLGTLSLTNNTDGIEINYPINAIVGEYLQTVKPITHTGQLVNNGNGASGDPTAANSEPFITRMIPNNLYFNNGNGLYYGNKARIILNNSGNKIVIGSSTDNTLNGIHLDKATAINGNTSITGALATTGGITAAGTIISSGGNVAGSILYEGKVPGTNNWWSLRDKYSPFMTVAAKTTGTFNVSANGVVEHAKFYVGVSGWVPVGIVGYNISYGTGNNKDARYANLWECFITNTNYVDYDVYNMKSSKINIKITFYVLYKKVI